MHASGERLFLPGYGALGSLYRPGLPAGWRALDPPGFRGNRGSLAASCRWLVAELDKRAAPVELAGHSMGAALAIAAAARRPQLVARLLLISPAGLPLSKPMATSLAEFCSHVRRGRYPLGEAVRSAGAALRSPCSAVRLARAVHSSDLTSEMEAVRGAAIDAVVVGTASDDLVTTEHCRRAAHLLGASYRELAVDGGHMWMLGRWSALAELLDAA